MKFQFLPENFSRSENAPPFETRKIRQFEVERIFLENKKMVDEKFAILRWREFFWKIKKWSTIYRWASLVAYKNRGVSP